MASADDAGQRGDVGDCSGDLSWRMDRMSVSSA